ncbi:MAG: sugar phosphate isomerase/epimerase [Rhodococcus sp. (in: high G+C Gram-positive bacteria)]|nr:MAG: sugar phosphate isomerase/epimerase [Rhodococcus sp. (in: high G+C Gram-positive bacteria)]
MTSHQQLVLSAMAFRGRDFEASLDAARASGFDAVGISIAHCVSCLERGMTPQEMAKAVRERGLEVANLELIRLGDGGPLRHLNEILTELVTVFEPDRIHVAAFAGTLDQVTAEFVQLCEAVPTTSLAVEFMPYSVINTFDAALSMVRAAGTDNAKIVLDIIHFVRSGGRMEQLTPDTLAHVADVQISDLLPRARIETSIESRHLRTFPGDGTLPIAEFLSTIRTNTDQPLPVTVEAISDATEQLPVDWVVERSIQTMTRLLDDTGWLDAQLTR